MKKLLITVTLIFALSSLGGCVLYRNGMYGRSYVGIDVPRATYNTGYYTYPRTTYYNDNYYPSTYSSSYYPSTYSSSYYPSTSYYYPSRSYYPSTYYYPSTSIRLGWSGSRHHYRPKRTHHRGRIHRPARGHYHYRR